MFVRSLLLAAAVAFATPAAAGQWDGTWTGNVDAWEIQLTVNGARGELRMVCKGPGLGEHMFTFPIAADGSFKQWVGGTRFSRRLIEGTLPTFHMPEGGLCGRGTATLRRA